MDKGRSGVAFEGFMEQKWRDALNVAAAEPQAWETEGPKRDKAVSNRATGEKAAQGQKGAVKTVGAAKVITQHPAWGHRKCRVQEQTGCEGDHLVLKCGKLRELSLCDRRKVLEASGLCMFCLRHPANVECFDQGGRLKPACMQPGCKGKHAAGVHELLGEAEASFNLVAEEDNEEDDEDLYVNVEEKKNEVRKKRRIREGDGGGPRRSERLRPKLAGGGQLGKGVLMLSILSVFVAHGGAHGASSGHYEALQEVMRNMAVGLEMAESIALGVEVLRMRAVDRRRQELYDLTSKVIENALRKLEHEKSTQAELLGEAANCTTAADELGEFNAREGVAFGLQIMGVFTLCRFLATLGWGGMSGLLVLIAKVWPVKPVKECRDVSTNTGVLGSQGQSRPLKPSAVSFREKRARWEWPRRMTPAGRQVRYMHRPEMATACKQNRGACGLEMSTRGRPAEGSVSGTRNRGQPACHEDPET